LSERPMREFASWNPTPRNRVEKETRTMVIESMLRQGSGKLPGPEPAPAFGQMSESEFKRHTRENYGF